MRDYPSSNYYFNIRENYCQKIMKEVKEVNAKVRNPGGNASKGAIAVDVNISSAFARHIGISKEDRRIIVEYDYDTKEIKIKKK